MHLLTRWLCKLHVKRFSNQKHTVHSDQIIQLFIQLRSNETTHHVKAVSIVLHSDDMV